MRVKLPPATSIAGCGPAPSGSHTVRVRTVEFAPLRVWSFCSGPARQSSHCAKAAYGTRTTEQIKANAGTVRFIIKLPSQAEPQRPSGDKNFSAGAQEKRPAIYG